MEKEQLVTTIKAIKTALASGIGASKGDMQLAIKIAFGFAQNTLEKLDAENEETGDVTNVTVYDDEHPDYIRQSLEEI